jgi:hypothetical protein
MVSGDRSALYSQTLLVRTRNRERRDEKTHLLPLDSPNPSRLALHRLSTAVKLRKQWSYPLLRTLRTFPLLPVTLLPRRRLLLNLSDEVELAASMAVGRRMRELVAVLRASQIAGKSFEAAAGVQREKEEGEGKRERGGRQEAATFRRGLIPQDPVVRKRGRCSSSSPPPPETRATSAFLSLFHDAFLLNSPFSLFLSLIKHHTTPGIEIDTSTCARNSLSSSYAAKHPKIVLPKLLTPAQSPPPAFLSVSVSQLDTSPPPPPVPVPARGSWGTSVGVGR